MNVIANGYELSRVNRNDTFTSQKRHRTISIIIQLLLITILFIWFIQKKKKIYIYDFMYGLQLKWYIFIVNTFSLLYSIYMIININGFGYSVRTFSRVVYAWKIIIVHYCPVSYALSAIS